MESFKDGREFLKAYAWEKHRTFESDQRKGVSMPPVQKPAAEGATLVGLVDPESLSVGNTPVLQIIRQRRSRRSFTDESISLEELSYLLWATQGLRDPYVAGRPSFRTVPSAGARHPFETYLSIHRVDGVQPGLYRYLPLDHKLCLLRVDDQLPETVSDACYGQTFVGKGAVVFIWTVIPYRTEWRYGPVSHKVIALDAGHLCQNLYIAAESIGCGTCAIGAYNQAKMDAVVGVDGVDEFTIYAAPVGRLSLA